MIPSRTPLGSALAILVVLLVRPVAPAAASASLRGGTGLINTPTAQVSSGTSVYYLDGSARTNGVWSLIGNRIEGGLLREEGENLYNMKMKFFTDGAASGGFMPAAALGVRGMSSDNDDREYYAVFSKFWSYPQSILSFGMLRSVRFDGEQTLFGGVEVPLLGKGRVLAEFDGKTGTYNAGVGYYVTQSIYLYHHFLDVTEIGPQDRQDKVLGVTYNTAF